MQNQPAISIVIPTLNEEQFLPRLLDSLSDQNGPSFEVIVADAGSTDRTREIAGKWGARIVEGGTPAAGRNAGANVATGEFLFFLDADVRLPAGFLKSAYEELERRYIDLATCEAIPESEVGFDKLLFSFATTVMRLTLRMEPRAPGYAIFVTRRLFRRVGGFDETVTLGEDHDFSKRAAKIRPLEFLTSATLYVSVRRLDKEGRVSYLTKAIHSDLHRRLIGEIRNGLIDYEFGRFGSELSESAGDAVSLAVEGDEMDDPDQTEEALGPEGAEQTGQVVGPDEAEQTDQTEHALGTDDPDQTEHALGPDQAETPPSAKKPSPSLTARLDRWLLQMDQTLRWLSQLSREKAGSDRQATVMELSSRAEEQFRQIRERVRRTARIRRRARREEKRSARRAGRRQSGTVRQKRSKPRGRKEQESPGQ